MKDKPLNFFFTEFKIEMANLFKFGEMNTDEINEFEEDISSIIPINHNEVYESYLIFEEQFKLQKLKSNFLKEIINILPKTHMLMIYLTIFNSISLTTIKRPVEDNDNYSFNDGYIEYNSLFWSIVYKFRNILIICGKGNNKNVYYNSLSIIHLSLTILINTNQISQTKIIKLEEWSNKQLIYYKSNISFTCIPPFNVKYKLFKSPPKVYEFNHYISIRSLINSPKPGKNYIKEYKVIKLSIISGVTHVRADDYERTNNYGVSPFRLISRQVSTAYLEEKYYPDIPFIKYLTKMNFFETNVSLLESQVSLLKSSLLEAFQSKNIEFIETIHRELSHKEEDLKIAIFLNHNWDHYFHISHNYDFRGRKYFTSPITFTNFKLSRLCFHRGFNGEVKLSSFSWDSCSETINKLGKFNQDFKEIVGFYLVSIGKSSSKRKKQLITSKEDIVSWGYDIYSSETNSLWGNKSQTLKEKYDAIELEYYKFSLKKLLNGDLTERILIKDATASGIQLQTYSVGVKHFKYLNMINMGSVDEFVDTYIFMAKAFLIEFGENIPKMYIKYLENRNINKTHGMIIGYAGGAEKCWSRIEKLIPSEDHDVKEWYHKFHKFIKQRLYEYIGQKESFSSFIKNILKEWEGGEEYTSHTKHAERYFIYYKSFKDEIDIRAKISSKEIRSSRVYRTPTTIIDKKKTDTSFPSHFIHGLEGEIITILHVEPYNLRFASVHDAYLISSFDCGKLVYSYGNIFKIKLNLPYQPGMGSLL